MAEYKASSPNTETAWRHDLLPWGAFPEGFQALIKKILVKHGWLRSILKIGIGFNRSWMP